MFKKIEFHKLKKVPLHSLHIGSKFYRKGKESPYFKISGVNQSTLRCTCQYYQSRIMYGRLKYFHARVELSQHTSVYVDK